MSDLDSEFETNEEKEINPDLLEEAIGDEEDVGFGEEEVFGDKANEW